MADPEVLKEWDLHKLQSFVSICGIIDNFANANKDRMRADLEKTQVLDRAVWTEAARYAYKRRELGKEEVRRLLLRLDNVISAGRASAVEGQQEIWPQVDTAVWVDGDVAELDIGGLREKVVTDVEARMVLEELAKDFKPRAIAVLKEEFEFTEYLKAR